MGFTFKKATKHNARLRAALVGPSGSGKTFTALAIATAMGKRVAVIDTERGSASKYAEHFAFDVLELESFAPATYVDAMNAAAGEGYDVVVIDSLSHAWMGRDGALEMVDRAAAKSRSGNSFDAWRSVTPHHNALVDAMLRLDAHLLVTMRVKTEYVLEEDSRGKKVPRKVGLQPVQRDGLEYEFDVVADLDLENRLVVSKTRCPELADKVFHRAGADVARILSGWLTGAPRPAAPTQPATPAESPREPAEMPAQLAEFLARVAEIELPGEGVSVWMKHRATLAPLPAADREAAWKALCRKVEVEGKMANAAVWLKKSIAEEDARRAGGGDPQAVLPDAGDPRAEAHQADDASEGDDAADDHEPSTWEQLAGQAQRADTLTGLADLWAGSTEERSAMSKSDREALWARFVDRGCALGNVEPTDAPARKLVNAALLKLVGERKPTPPNGGGKAPASDAAPATAHGGSVDATSGAQAPVASDDAWRETRAGITAHVAALGPRHIENSGRRHLRDIAPELREHAVTAYAAQLRDLSRHTGRDDEGHPVEIERPGADCRAEVLRWLREGPRVAVLRQRVEARAKIAAGGAR